MFPIYFGNPCLGRFLGVCKFDFMSLTDFEVCNVVNKNDILCKIMIFLEKMFGLQTPKC